MQLGKYFISSAFCNFVHFTRVYIFSRFVLALTLNDSFKGAQL